METEADVLQDMDSSDAFVRMFYSEDEDDFGEGVSEGCGVDMQDISSDCDVDEMQRDLEKILPCSPLMQAQEDCEMEAEEGSEAQDKTGSLFEQIVKDTQRSLSVVKAGGARGLGRGLSLFAQRAIQEGRTPREKLEKKKQEKRVEFLKVFRSLAAERTGRIGDSEGGRTRTMQDWAARVRVYVCKQCNGSGFASLPQPLAVQEGGICIRAVEGGEASALARDKAKKGLECVGLSVLSAGEGGQDKLETVQDSAAGKGQEASEGSGERKGLVPTLNVADAQDLAKRLNGMSMQTLVDIKSIAQELQRQESQELESQLPVDRGTDEGIAGMSNPANEGKSIMMENTCGASAGASTSAGESEKERCEPENRCRACEGCGLMFHPLEALEPAYQAVAFGVTEKRKAADYRERGIKGIFSLRVFASDTRSPLARACA